MQLFIYVLRLDDFTRYVGLTSDVHRRYRQHLSGKGSVHTKKWNNIILEETIPIRVTNIYEGRLAEYRYAKQLRIHYGRYHVRGGELSPKMIKRLTKKAIISKP
jgi:predicted GIY-YIG superfamily endonuclease